MGKIKEKDLTKLSELSKEDLIRIITKDGKSANISLSNLNLPIDGERSNSVQEVMYKLNGLGRNKIYRDEKLQYLKFLSFSRPSKSNHLISLNVHSSSYDGFGANHYLYNI